MSWEELIKLIRHLLPQVMFGRSDILYYIIVVSIAIPTFLQPIYFLECFHFLSAGLLAFCFLFLDHCIDQKFQVLLFRIFVKIHFLLLWFAPRKGKSMRDLHRSSGCSHYFLLMRIKSEYFCLN